MPDQFLAPGVYVKEVSSLGKAIVPISTAVPAFLGYTEKGPSDPQRIDSMQHFVEVFGGPKASVTMNTSGGISSPTSAISLPGPALYYAMVIYFANGGGPCWIVSVGPFKDPAVSDFLGTELIPGPLVALDKIDEISLVYIPELALIEDPNASGTNSQKLAAHAAKQGEVVQKVLADCARRGDRFALFDIFVRSYSNSTKAFRENCGTQNLSYGAAYYPQVEFGMAIPDAAIIFANSNNICDGKTLPEVLALAEEDSVNGRLAAGIIHPRVATIRKNANKLINYYIGAGAAMAAIYGTTDALRGVWKAPAGMSLTGINKPIQHYVMRGDDDVADTSGNGKDINEIRLNPQALPQVWGARTLAGGDLDYRYISIRRFMIFVGQTLKRSSSFAVFEANDASTWGTLTTMCESFLSNLWRDGALMGGKPSEAFKVNIGLGKSMSAEDIQNGILRIDISMAPVRPAEFIHLQFSHLVQNL